MTLDGYTTDADGKFDWNEPDAEVFAFITDQQREIGTYLYGRGMYETMAVWETLSAAQLRDDVPAVIPGPLMRAFAEVWRAADKVVYSTTLQNVSTARTRIERRFDADAIREMKGNVSVAGPTLAAHAIQAGLVDEYRLFVMPIVVGGGTPVFPDGVRAGLELADERRFDSGAVYLRYRGR